MYDLSQSEREQIIELYDKWNEEQGGQFGFDEFIYWIKELIEGED